VILRYSSSARSGLSSSNGYCSATRNGLDQPVGRVAPPSRTARCGRVAQSSNARMPGQADRPALHAGTRCAVRSSPSVSYVAGPELGFGGDQSRVILHHALIRPARAPTARHAGAPCRGAKAAVAIVAGRGLNHRRAAAVSGNGSRSCEIAPFRARAPRRVLPSLETVRLAQQYLKRSSSVSEFQPRSCGHGGPPRTASSNSASTNHGPPRQIALQEPSAPARRYRRRGRFSFSEICARAFQIRVGSFVARLALDPSACEPRVLRPCRYEPDSSASSFRSSAGTG
jgi:hypothetical protein